MHDGKAFQFPLRLLPGHVGHSRLLYLLSQPLRFLLLLVHDPEFLLDRLQLLPEIKFPLGAVHLPLHLLLDPFAYLHDLDLVREDGDGQVQPLQDGKLLQDLLLLGHADLEARNGKVGKLAGILYVHDHDLELRGEVGRKVHELGKEVGQQLDPRLRLLPRHRLVGMEVRHDLEVGLRGDNLHSPVPDGPLDEDIDRPVGHHDFFQYVRQGPHGIEVVEPLHLLHIGHDRLDPDPLFLHQGIIDEPYGPLVLDPHRENHLREKHRFADRQDGNLDGFAEITLDRPGQRSRTVWIENGRHYPPFSLSLSSPSPPPLQEGKQGEAPL